ncbi:unnamed protein product, partial [Chrysoparadoxa australica]
RRDGVYRGTRSIQMLFRCHTARETLRLKKKGYRNATIIQKYSRRKMAYLRANFLREQRDCATVIQTCARVYLAKRVMEQRRRERAALHTKMSTRI